MPVRQALSMPNDLLIIAIRRTLGLPLLTSPTVLANQTSQRKSSFGALQTKSLFTNGATRSAIISGSREYCFQALDYLYRFHEIILNNCHVRSVCFRTFLTDGFASMSCVRSVAGLSSLVKPFSVHILDFFF